MKFVYSSDSLRIASLTLPQHQCRASSNDDACGNSRRVLSACRVSGTSSEPLSPGYRQTLSALGMHSSIYIWILAAGDPRDGESIFVSCESYRRCQWFGANGRPAQGPSSVRNLQGTPCAQRQYEIWKARASWAPVFTSDAMCLAAGASRCGILPSAVESEHAA